MRGALAIIVLAFCWAAPAAWAQQPTLELHASVERTTVRENESFVYTVRAEGFVRGEPDPRPLEEDFDILQRTSSTRIQIVNGQSSQVTEWFYQLMPKRAGLLTLPPLELSGILTNPIELDVREAPTDALADIFIEVEVDPLDPVVQSQVIYTFRLFLGVSTGRATITAPEVSGGAIVERLDEEQYQAVRDGRSFHVRERRYAIFPQEPGKLAIGPATFEAMVIPGRGFSRMQRLRSESVDLDVRRAVPPPAALAGAAWLPAREVRISERWSDADGELVIGIPQTRTIIVEAEGLQETQLPALRVPQRDGVRQYADQPDLSREITQAGLAARRVERYVVMGVTAGSIELPPVELPWWNVQRQRWEVARLPERTLTVLPAAAPAMEPQAEPVSEEAPGQPGGAGRWGAVSAALLFAWLATLALWLRERRSAAPVRRKRTAAPQQPRRAANRRLLRELRAACDRSDAAAARELLLEWAAVRFTPDAPPRTLGALAERLPADLAAEVRVLESHTYGAKGESWDGAGLRAALADVDSVARTSTRDRSDPLLPLYR